MPFLLALVFGSVFFIPPNSARAAPGVIEHVGLSGEFVNLFPLFPNAQTECTFVNQKAPFSTEQLRLVEVLKVLEMEPQYFGYLKSRYLNAKSALCIYYSASSDKGFFNTDYNVLALWGAFPDDDVALVAIHELRHLDQDVRGIRRGTDHSIAEEVRKTYAMEADAQAFATLYAWKLKELGRPQVWRALVKLEHYNEIAEAFEATMKLAGDELASTRAAFQQWYRIPWLTKGYYQGALMGYLDAMDKFRIPESSKQILPKDYFSQLCVLPDGRNYGCHLTSEIEIVPVP